MSEDEIIEDTPVPNDGLGMTLNPLMTFYKWGAENKPVRRRNAGQVNENIDGDIDVGMKIKWPNVNNKNVAMSNTNAKDESILILRQIRTKMVERALTPKKNITAAQLIAEERNESDYRTRLTMGRLGFFMKQMTTSTNIVMNNSQPQNQQPEQPKPRWI